MTQSIDEPQEGLEALAAAANRHARETAVAMAKGPWRAYYARMRRRLTAGSLALRTLSALLVIFGAWPFFYVIFELILLAHGGKTFTQVRVTSYALEIDAVGWPSVILGLIYSAIIWLLATATCGLGYALQVLRDLIPQSQ